MHEKQWAPKLHATLNDRVVMLLALKRDLRRDFPVLDLAFLPSKESVSYSAVCPHTRLLASRESGF
jgi:hypothetical protein